MVLAAILAKNRKNDPKLHFGPLYLENSPTYRIDMYDIFYNAGCEEFESEEKTGCGSSFSRHFDEKPQKTAKNLGVFPQICEVIPLTYFNIWKNCLQHFNYTSVVN